MNKIIIVVVFLAINGIDIIIAQNGIEENDTTKLINNDIKKINERYNNYIQCLHSGALNQFSTFRKYNFLGDEIEKKLMFYPKTKFFDLNIPAHFIMSYYIYIENNKVSNVEILNIAIFDTGYSLIYSEYEGMMEVSNYYKLNIDKGELERKLFKKIVDENIIFMKKDYIKDNKIKLQIFFHQEYLK